MTSETCPPGSRELRARDLLTQRRAKSRTADPDMANEPPEPRERPAERGGPTGAVPKVLPWTPRFRGFVFCWGHDLVHRVTVERFQLFVRGWFTSANGLSLPAGAVLWPKLLVFLRSALVSGQSAAICTAQCPSWPGGSRRETLARRGRISHRSPLRVSR